MTTKSIPTRFPYQFQEKKEEKNILGYFDFKNIYLK